MKYVIDITTDGGKKILGKKSWFPRCKHCLKDLNDGDWVYWCEVDSTISCEDCKAKFCTVSKAVRQHIDYYGVLVLK